MKRRSPFSGELVETKPAVAGPDLATQITELRTQLAVEQAKREAAEARCAELERVAQESTQRGDRLLDDLERAQGRIEAIATIQPAQQISIPAPVEASAPIAYSGIVTNRDANGRIEKFEIVPREIVVTRD